MHPESIDTGLSGVKHLMSRSEYEASYEAGYWAGYWAGSNSPHYLTGKMPPETDLSPPYEDEERNRVWLIGYRVAVE